MNSEAETTTTLNSDTKRFLSLFYYLKTTTIPRNENNDEKQKSTTHNNKTTTSRQQSTTTKQINFSEIMHSLYFLDVFIVLLKQVQLNNHYKKYLIILAFRRKGFIFIFIFETSACNNNDKKY